MIQTRLFAGRTGSFTASFATNPDKVPIDPTTVTFYLRSPTGFQETYTHPCATTTRISTGVYRLVRLFSSTDQAGDWHVRVVGTGACADAIDAHFRLEAASF